MQDPPPFRLGLLLPFPRPQSRIKNETYLGNENSARSFSDPLGSWTFAPSGHGCPRNACFFPGFRGPDRSFWPRTSTGISAWTSAGCPAPKLTVATEIKVKLIPKKYFFAFAFVLILIGQIIFRINDYIDTSPRILHSLSLS